jgi:hypothetical protein
MPHGSEFEFTFEKFKNQAKAAGGLITDDLLEAFRQEMQKHMGHETTDQMVMMDQDVDYI